MLDRDGYRPNVGIIIVNHRNEVFWGKRIKEHSWQFPQGGIKYGETPEQAMFRELYEETGLKEEHVRVIGRTREWLRYDVPREWIKRDIRGHYRGQKQIWFLIRLIGRDCDVRLRASDHPEFDAWRWHDYWVPLDAVIEFKREVYSQALNELSRLLFARKTDNTRYLRQRVRHDRDEAEGLRDGPREAVSPPCDPCVETVEPPCDPCDPCVEVVDVRMEVEVRVEVHEEAGNGEVRQVQVHLESHRVQAQQHEADPEADCRDAEAVLHRRT